MIHNLYVILALYWASYGGHVEVVDRLLANKFTDLNLQNKLGDTALLASSIEAHPDVTERLIKKGADAKIANANGETPLSVAHNPQGTCLPLSIIWIIFYKFIMK